MPLYEYLCDACGHRFELIRKYSDPPVEACPVCGGAVQKLLSSPAIQFKGSGWYITDYARAGKSDGKGDAAGDAKGEPASSKGGSDAASGAPTSAKADAAGESQTAAKAESKTDSKSETKTESKPSSSTSA